MFKKCLNAKSVGGEFKMGSDGPNLLIVFGYKFWETRSLFANFSKFLLDLLVKANVFNDFIKILLFPSLNKEIHA